MESDNKTKVPFLVFTPLAIPFAFFMWVIFR